jgi:autotransporter-associated beta strand protein
MKTSNPNKLRQDSVIQQLRRPVWKKAISSVLLVQFALWSVQVNGATGTWILNGNGNWTGTPANWDLGVIPNAAGDIAVFRNEITAARTVTLNAPITLGGMRVGDILGGSAYTFTGTNALIMDSGGAGNAFINLYNNSTNNFQTPLTLNSNTDLNAYTGTIDINGASNAQVVVTGSGDIIKNGAGQVRINGTLTGYSGDYVLNLGTLAIGGANGATINLGTGTGGITLNGSGALDRTILQLRNNGTGNNGTIQVQGNNKVTVQGAVNINTDTNFVSGANTGNTFELNELVMNGGLLQTTGGNSYGLRVAGTTSLNGQTNVFFPSSAQLTLAGVIDDGLASRSLVKEGLGRLLVSNTANTYDGVTAIKNGILRLGAGANLGAGTTYVNGGVLVVENKATLDAVSTKGLVFAGQLGTSRYSVGAVGITQNYGVIDAVNNVAVNVPVAGLALAIDGTVTNDIDLSKVGNAGDGNRVWLTNVIGADQTFQGVLLPSSDNSIRLTSSANSASTPVGNTLIISGTSNRLGGPASTANLIFGYDNANPMVFNGTAIMQMTGGTVSIRTDNATTGNVIVNRGVTVNINGAVTTPLGTGPVTALGGAITTDANAAATAAKFGNTSFTLFGGSSLLLDNSGVVTTNTNQRLDPSTDISLTSSTLRLLGDGGAATVSSQAIDQLTYAGGNTISVDTDGTTASRLTTLTLNSLTRTGNGTLNIRNIANTATTLGTSAGTQKLIISTGAPTVNNGMIGANIAIWGGANLNDAGTPLFATYDSTHGLTSAAFTLNNTFTAATTGSLVNFDATAYTGAGASVQALRIRSTANTNTFNASSAMTLGAAAGVGQGAGLFLAHTANNGITHTTNFGFGSQEGMIYAATTGGTAGIITLSGVLTGSAGITRFGDGVLSLTGQNTFSGPLNLNAGETRLSQGAAGLPTDATAKDVNIWGGSVYLQSGSSRYQNNLIIKDDARIGNVNVGASGFNNLVVEPRVGSTAPTQVRVQNQAGGNITTVYGTLTLNNDAQFSIQHPIQLNGGIAGTGRFDKFYNERLIVTGDSSGYSGAITSYAGSMTSLNTGSAPFGTGAITLNPGAAITLASSNNLSSGQLTINSDRGGISGIGMLYVGDPMTALPSFAINTTAPWAGGLGLGAVGFSQDIDLAALATNWGGDVYLGAALGYTGIFTGDLAPASGNRYLLGTQQGTFRVAVPLAGGNSIITGISMTGESSRADQTVNNSGGVVQFDVLQAHTGGTVFNPGVSVRLSARDALAGTGDITLAGGSFRVDSASAQNRAIVPQTISNNMVFTADSTLQMENIAYDVRLGGTLALAPGSTGVVRTFNIGTDQTGGDVNNAGMVWIDGGITDGVGGSGNHFVKGGLGTLFFNGVNTYTGSTTLAGGLIGVNQDSDWGQTSLINMVNGGIAVWENSFTTSRNYHVHGSNGYFDIAGGLTLTQDASSVIDGGNSLMKRGLGTMILNGQNSVIGLFVADGVLQVNNQLALGDPATTSQFSYGGDQLLGGAGTNTRYMGGTTRINFTGSTNRGAVFNNNGNTNTSGGIDITAGNTFTMNGAFTQGTELDYGFKTGPGTLITTGTNTMRGFAMVNGVWQFANASPWTNSTTTASDNTFIDMMGGTIRAVNTTANFALTNQASTTTYNYGGGMTLAMGSGTGFSMEFNADNIIRQNQGTLVLQLVGATTLGGTGGSNTARVITTNAVNASLARASALTNGIFAPSLIGATATGDGFFLENDATNGFKPYSGASNTSLSGAFPNAIADISAEQNLTGENGIYAFRTNANVLGGTLRIAAVDNVKTGGILINGSNTVSSNLIFDPASATAPGTGTTGEGLVFVKSGASAIISGNITSNAFTKFGNGSLELQGAAMAPSFVSVQAGTLKLGGQGVFGTMNADLRVNGGAALDLNGYNGSFETLESNNRLIGAVARVGGAVKNTSGTPATLNIAGPTTSTYNGTLELNMRLIKQGAGVLTLNGYTASTPDAGVNTHTGGTDIYGIGTTGGLNINNSTTALGGGNGITPGDVNLYGGTLGLLFSNGTTGINGSNGQQYNNMVAIFGKDGTAGLTLNVRGPGLVTVNRGTPLSNGGFGVGNIMQVGVLNMSNTTLQVSGGNNYRFRVGGPTNIMGSQAAFQTNSDGPSGIIELFGVISGGTLTKLGDGTIRNLTIGGNANTYSGGTNIIGGDIQVLATSGTPLGTGPVRIFPDGALRIAGNNSVDGTKLTTLSRAGALGAVVIEGNFNPSVLDATNFSSAYNTALQLGEPFFQTALDMNEIGDGRAFLGGGLNGEVAYVAPTLGAGAPDAWNPTMGVYRIAPGTSSFAFSGTDNVLTGDNYLQVGPQRNNIFGVIVNGGNIVVMRNANDFTGGAQITKGASIYTDIGGRVGGESALGDGDIEVYGTLRIRGAQGSMVNPATGLHYNDIYLRPGGQVGLHDADGTNAIPFIGAGGQGRWADTVGIDLNGGEFRYDGGANMTTTETIGDVTARKRGLITVVRNSAASAAQLNVGDISRAEAGILTLNYNSGFLGIPITTPLSYERLLATSIGGVAVTDPGIRSGTTLNGSGATNGGMVAPWIVDRVTHSFVGYNPTAANTGFQPLISSATPGAGQISYNQILAGATFTATGSNDIVDVTTAAKTLGANVTMHALRTSQNISPTASFNTMTFNSGGLIATAGTINPTGAITAGVVSPMTLNFGAAGAGEAFIYNSGTVIIQAQMNAALGLTKFGAGQLQIHGVNPGIGGPVTLHEGTTYVRVPYSLSTSSVGQVLNSQDVIVNSGTLNLQSFNANPAGTATEIASNVQSGQGYFASDIYIQGDAVLRNNGQAQYVRIADLTIGNSAGSSPMTGNSSITLELQSGIWVTGTTTLNPEARINGTFSGFSQTSLAGVVTGAGGLIKYGNGATTLMNAANDYAGGTTIWGSTTGTATSTVASTVRGSGTPFSTGDINIMPGGHLRVADNANIASNAVYLTSDGYGLGGIGLAHNGVLPSIITTGTPTAGQVKVSSSGAFAGVVSLDYGYYSQPLNMTSIPGGKWWIGNSQQAETYYFAPTFGAASGGKYLLGGGGNQGGLNFGSVSVSNGRTTLYENLFSGGTAGQVAIEIGAATGDFASTAPAFINGNSGYIALSTRNTGLVGDVRVNTGSVLAIGNNFALGNGRLILNGGTTRSDFGNNNFTNSAITLNNTVVMQGDMGHNAGDMVLRGPLQLSDVTGAGATRSFNVSAGNFAVRGVVSGVNGSSVIKVGAGNLHLTGVNTYNGFTQVSGGFLFAAGDILPNQDGPLGNSDSAIILSGGSLRASGRMTIGRDLIVNTTGTFDTGVANRVLMLGGISVASAQTLTVGAAGADVAAFRGGRLDLQGVISGPGALTVGTTAAVPAPSGTVTFGGNSNGYGINTYSGGTTFQSARVQIGGTSYFTGPANNPTTIFSGPFGSGALTFAGGEQNRGTLFESTGGSVTIVNALNAINVAANTSMTFGGNQAITFTRGLDVNSDTSLRTRTIAVQNQHAPITFSGILSASGAAGVLIDKTGPGMLVLTGANTFATSSTTGIRVSGGVLRVNSDAALGAGTTVNLNGGVLSFSESVTSSRVLNLAAGSGIDVASGKTVTLSAATTGAFTLSKSGEGTLLLNNSANTITTLTLGGQPVLDSNVGRYTLGGIVGTTATTGTPFATSAVTLAGGALALVGGASAQALAVPTLTYTGAGAVALNKGATTSQLTLSTALTRGGAPAGYTPALTSVNPGTMYVVPTALAELGTNERLMITAGAPANTATGGGNILTTPSVFVRLQTPGDANFARYDATTGIREHDVTTVTSLAATASANVADISVADVAGAGNIDVQALRTSANITPADVSTLIRIARGGLIMNGADGVSLSAPVLFGTGPGASLTEAIVYVREGQAAASSISGGISARDFTKTGPGVLEVGGTGNLLNTNNSRLPLVSVQDGTMRFASTGAAFQVNNSFRNTAAGDLLGHFALNVNEAGVFDLNGLNISVAGLTGNGTVRSNISGAATLTAVNGFGADVTWSGRITNGAGTVSLVKSGSGALLLNGFSDHSGGTVVRSGRVTNATGNATPLGRLEPQTVNSLGSGNVTLEGGRLRLNGLAVLNGATNLTEVTDGIDYLRWGNSANGVNVTVSATSYANGVLLPLNTTSQIDAVTRNAGINTLTLNAPQLNFVEGSTVIYGGMTINNDATLRLAGGTLWVGGQFNAAGQDLVKTGSSTLVLYNSAGGANQNQVGSWLVSGGLVQARSSEGSANPLGANQTIELNAGSTSYGVAMLTDGDGTALGMRTMTYADTSFRFGSSLPVSSNQFVSGAGSRIQVDRAFLANSSWKTVQINNVEAAGALGTPYAYFLTGNNDSIWVNGTTTFERDLIIQADGGGLTLNGPITGNGTFNRRSNGGTLYINSDNSAGYSGGTFLSASGRNYFGSFEGGQVTLSNTAKFGSGHIFQGPISMFQVNDAGNLVEGQNIYVTGNLSWMAAFSLASDLSLDDVRLRALGLGGVQNSATDYYLKASNPSSAALALGTIYTKALDMRSIGDGMWFLGSATNGIGANGSYNAATLAPGIGDTYRLGAGGNTLFFGSNGNSNILTDVNAGKAAGLVVGTPTTVQDMSNLANGTGTIVLMQGQNYTGSTLINRNSTLEARGTLTTSDIKIYGSLNVAGEAGTLINPNTSAPIPVTLRPGSLVRLDNLSGVLPASATQGRWGDSTPFNMNNSVLRLQGNPAVEVVEKVGNLNVGRGANRVEVVRGVIGRGTELQTPAITRQNFGTLQFIHNSSQLGSDERVIISSGGTIPTVTNGMVEPWMVSASDQHFLTYNTDLGFTLAGFSRVQGTATHTALVDASTDRLLINATQTMNGGDVRGYAVRLEADMNLTTATAATDTVNRLIIDSGGLIAQSGATRTIQGGLWAGAAGDKELIIYNAGTLNVGLLANNTTSGRISASSITKMGAGTFQILSEQPNFLGDIRIQQGALQLQYTQTIATNITSQMGGAKVGGNDIILDGNNTSLILRIGNDSWTVGTTATFNNNIVLGDNVSVATINYDRAGGSITSRTMILNNLTFGNNEGDNGQVLRLFGPTNTNAAGFWRIQFNGTTTLKGRSAIAVDNGYSGGANDAYLMGKVTGTGMLIKGPSDSRTRTLFLQNVTNFNDWSGGTVLQGGTLQVFAKATNVAANANSNITAGGIGTGDITLMQGTLDLRVDNDVGGAADTNLERTLFIGTGGTLPNVIVNGNSIINVDRTGLVAVGTTKTVVLGNLTVGQQYFTVNGGNSYGLEFAGTTTLLGSPHFNNATDLVLNGAISTGGGQVVFNKNNVGTMWVNSANTTLTGPTYVNAGLLAFGNRVASSNTAHLGSGTIFVNPGASVRVNNVANVGAGGIRLIGTQYAPAVFRSVGAFTQAQYASMIQTYTPETNQVLMLALEANNANALNLSTLANGRLYLGANGDRTYNAPSLSPGLANLDHSVIGGTSTNPVYRFSHQSGNTLTVALASGGNLSDVGGPTDVQVGSQAILGPNGNWGSNGFVYFQNQNTYTGQTVVGRSATLRFNTTMAAGDTAGPLGSNPNATIDVYGGLRFEGTGSLRSAVTPTSHFYNNLRLHPTSTLTFQDMTATGAGSNRWEDGVPIQLDGSSIVAEATDGANDNSETIGNLTFDRGSRVGLASQNNGDAILVAASIDRAAASTGAGTGRGTLVVVPSNPGPTVTTVALGAALTAGSPQQQLKFTTAPAVSTVSAVSNMLPGYYMDGQSHRFLSYNSSTGVVPVADGSMVAMPAGPGAGTEVVNITATTSMGAFETSIFALRGGNVTLNSPSATANDNSATIILTGSGSDIGAVVSTANTFTINPNLKFGADGSNEAIFYTGGNIQFNGNLTAGSVTKYGTAILVIGNDQSDAARGTGNGYSGGWVVNEGGLWFSQFGAGGNAVAGNTIVLNGSQASSGALYLRAQPSDTLLNYSYTFGRITGVDLATIDWDPGADNRVHSISDIEIQQSGGIGNDPTNGTMDAYLRVANNRSRTILSAGDLIMTSNGILNVDTTATPTHIAGGSGTNAGSLTGGLSSGLSIASLTGTGRLTKWGDGTLYVRGESAGYTAPVIIDQGAVHVAHNGSLGTGPLVINRYGVLEVGVANYSQSNSTTVYNEGSVERWNVNNARSGALNLGKGTLQIAADQPTTDVDVTLNGGGVEAFLRTDDNISVNGGGVLRVLNPNINFTLAGDSFVGSRYYLGMAGLNMGQQVGDNRPMEEYLSSGALLEIKGVISGPGKLTKAGYDTVILSGTNTYEGGTFVEGGKLMIGKDNTLPTNTTLTTTGNGILDLNGQNQTVGVLTNPGTPATTANVTSGFITNASTSVKTLTVGNTTTSDFTYSGVIQHNVALTMAGTGTLSLNNVNTYYGATTLTNGGSVKIGANGNIADSVWLNIGAASKFDVSAKTASSGNFVFDGRVSGGGTSSAGSSFASAGNAARIDAAGGTFTIGDNVGEVSKVGFLAPGGNSGPEIANAGNQIGHVYVNGNLTVSGPVTGSPNNNTVDRVQMQLNGSTANAGVIDPMWDGTTSWLVTNAPNYLNGAQGTINNHDYVNVSGNMALNHYGRVVVSNFETYTPVYGDMFNLFDWTTLTAPGFDAGSTQYAGGSSVFDLQLPNLSAYNLLWDTSLFMTYGTLVVVPEPGRALLMILGLMALFMRRRRQD